VKGNQQDCLHLPGHCLQASPGHHYTEMSDHDITASECIGWPPCPPSRSTASRRPAPGVTGRAPTTLTAMSLSRSRWRLRQTEAPAPGKQRKGAGAARICMRVVMDKERGERVQQAGVSSPRALRGCVTIFHSSRAVINGELAAVNWKGWPTSCVGRVRGMARLSRHSGPERMVPQGTALWTTSAIGVLDESLRVPLISWGVLSSRYWQAQGDL
jgi:hypothetical protein